MKLDQQSIHTAKRVAVVDIGTSSVKAIVGEADGLGSVRVLCDLSEVTRLGEGVDAAGNLHREAQRRTAEAVVSLLRAAREWAPERTCVVATSAVRDAANRSDFTELVAGRTGSEVEVLSETREGSLSFAAVSLDPDLCPGDGPMTVIDVGGGSTEVVSGSAGGVEFAVSARMGAVRLTEQALAGDPPTCCEVLAAFTLARAEIERVVGNHRAGHLVGVGGTVVNLARIHYGLGIDRTPEVHGSRLSRVHIDELVSDLGARTSEQRRDLVGLDPARAGIIVGGAIVVQSAMDTLGAGELIVSVRGLRHGVLYAMLGAK